MRHEKLILRLNIPKRVKGIFQSVGERILREGKVSPQSLIIYFSGSQEPHVKLVRTYLWLLNDTNEIIYNMNFVIKGLSELTNTKLIRRREKIKRWRLLTRLYFYEYARIGDVYGHFLEALVLLGKITKSERRDLRNIFYKGFEPQLKARNHLFHAPPSALPEESRFQVLSAGREIGLDSSLLNLSNDKFDKEFANAIHKQIIEFTLSGRRIRRFMQRMLNLSRHSFSKTN